MGTGGGTFEDPSPSTSCGGTTKEAEAAGESKEAAGRSKYESRERPPMPKKVWNISAIFPGLSAIPPSSLSWQFKINFVNLSLLIQDVYSIQRGTTYIISNENDNTNTFIPVQVLSNTTKSTMNNIHPLVFQGDHLIHQSHTAFLPATNQANQRQLWPYNQPQRSQRQDPQELREGHLQ